MSKIKYAFWGTLLLSSGLWMYSDTLLPEPFTYFSFRSVFVQYSGVIAIVLMSVAMYLAIRPRWLERPLGGLDRMYRLHKWLGIASLLTAALHWWWAQGTKWMVGWGWLERPVRGGARNQYQLSDLQQWFAGQRSLAETLGEWAFYPVAILLILALVKVFPYHWFKKTHKWLALGYLILAYHTVILTKFTYWSEPVGWLVAIHLAIGVYAAVITLTGQIGRKQQYSGQICTFEYHPKLHAIEGSIQMGSNWPGHVPGQFAFVTSNKAEGAHPYTIASAWEPDSGRLTFIVKELGDWTKQLRDYLKVGMQVTVEGPYGCSDFRDNAQQQIWVGAGIGITPFIAKLKHLAQHPEHRTIDLFHVTSDFDQQVFDKLAADASAAQVRLHLWYTPTAGKLTPQKIRDLVPNWQTASIWFCGPAAFGEVIQKDFIQQGLQPENYHHELFTLR